MTVSLWRIAVDAASHGANDLSGTGAAKTAGRWNSVGTPVVYCATSIALATLETVHYLRGSSMPFNRYLVRVDIADPVWNSRAVLDPLPGGWNAVPAGSSSRMAGDSWVASAASALPAVPSVIVPEECNVLINPLHPDAAGIMATTIKRWIYDPRFFT
jgi:RES domain-containing protein